MNFRPIWAAAQLTAPVRRHSVCALAQRLLHAPANWRSVSMSSSVNCLIQVAQDCGATQGLHAEDRPLISNFALDLMRRLSLGCEASMLNVQPKNERAKRSSVAVTPS